MRTYELTFGEIVGLGSVGLIASFCFGLGSAFLNYAAQISISLDLAPDVAPKTLQYWQHIQDVTTSWGVGFLVAGGIAVALGGIGVGRIIWETKFQK